MDGPPRPSPHGCCARLHGSEGLARTLPGWMADGERADGCPLCAADVDRSNPSCMHACSLDECNSRAKDTRRGSVLTLQLLLSLSAPSPQPLLQGPPLGLQARKAHPNQPHLADPHRGCAHARRCQVRPWKAARVRLPRLEGDQRQQRPRHLGQGALDCLAVCGACPGLCSRAALAYFGWSRGGGTVAVPHMCVACC